MTRFYRFPCFDLSGPDLFALEQAMPVLKAEAELDGPVADARLYDVVLAATGSKEVAGAALSYRIKERLRRNETPDV